MIGKTEGKVPIQLRWIWARNRGPIAPARSATSQNHVRAPSAAAKVPAAVAATRQATERVFADSGAQELRTLLPAPAILALVQHDCMHMGQAHQPLQLRHPPRSGCAWVFKNPRHALPFKNSDEAESSTEAAIPLGNRNSHILGIVMKMRSPGIISRPPRKAIYRGKASTWGSEHGRDNAAPRAVLFDTTKNLRAREIKILAMQPLPLPSAEAGGSYRPRHAAASREEVGDVAARHAHGGGPIGRAR